jgi:hypothetical protein
MVETVLSMLQWFFLIGFCVFVLGLMLNALCAVLGWDAGEQEEWKTTVDGIADAISTFARG